MLHWLPLALCWPHCMAMQHFVTCIWLSSQLYKSPTACTELRVLRLGAYANKEGRVLDMLPSLELHVDTLPGLRALQELHLSEAEVRAAVGKAGNPECGCPL